MMFSFNPSNRNIYVLVLVYVLNVPYGVYAKDATL